MNRLLFITMHFPPSRDIGARACEQIARHLSAHGWEPIVLTRPRHLIENGDRNAPRTFDGTIVEAGTLPHPLDLYRRLKAEGRTQKAEVPPVLLPSSPRILPSVRRWVLSLLMTPDRYTGWILPATVAGLRAIRRERITHIMSSGPFWTNHIVAMILARLTGLAWTAHYRDPWNQVPQLKPVSALSAMIERALERMVIRRATSVVCVTESHSSLLRDVFSLDKFVTIPNGFDGDEWRGVEAVPAEGKFTITYTGSFMMGTRSPRPLFRALKRLELRNVRVKLFGDCQVAEGIPVTEMARQYGLGEVVTVGAPLGRRETLREMMSADLLLLLAEGWSLQIPGKTYEYLRAGRPILALTSEGALADLLRKTGGAAVVDPADDAAIERAILDAMSGRLAAANENLIAGFDRRHLAGQFATLFNSQPASSRALKTLYSTN